MAGLKKTGGDELTALRYDLMRLKMLKDEYPEGIETFETMRDIIQTRVRILELNDTKLKKLWSK